MSEAKGGGTWRCTMSVAQPDTKTSPAAPRRESKSAVLVRRDISNVLGEKLSVGCNQGRDALWQGSERAAARLRLASRPPRFSRVCLWSDINGYQTNIPQR